MAGSGAAGSANDAVACASDSSPPRIEFDAPTVLASAMFTHTTYTALSMRDGDAFAKRSGGVGGRDLDFLLLTVTGLDAANAITRIIEFYRADFRAADNKLDDRVDTWTAVQLAAPGAVTALEFGLQSSAVGAFGANTPLSFALDNLQPVPVPAAAGLLPALGLLVVYRRRRVAAG